MKVDIFQYLKFPSHSAELLDPKEPQLHICTADNNKIRFLNIVF